MFKFCCYISIPIGMTVAISGSPKNLEALIKNVRGSVCPRVRLFLSGNPGTSLTTEHGRDCVMCACMQRDYVMYPPEGPKPPTADELHDMVQKEQQRRRAA